MKEQLNQLRVDIDGIAQVVYDLQPFKPELSIINLTSLKIGGYALQTFQLYEAHKSLLLAKAWIGKLLGTLGGTSPYANDGKRNSVADIEPTDAKATEPLASAKTFFESNHIQKVDILRQYIEKEINKIENLNLITTSNPQPPREAAICRTQVWVHLTEARLHLGFELGRIHDSK